MKIEKLTILGAGSWGTALAQHLASYDIPVHLWGRNEEELLSISGQGENTKYLPGVPLSRQITPVASLEESILDSQCIVFAVPSSGTRELASKVKNYLTPDMLVISSAKGLEPVSNKRVSQIIKEVCENSLGYMSVLSGPTFALEIAKGLPSAVVLASQYEDTDKAAGEALKRSAKIFHRGNMRVYTSRDLIGVELGGVLKNMISLAAGIGDGLGSGQNARAALLTRGLKEISRLIEKEGGSLSSITGLSGLGDLLLTATGDLSRNRRFGLLLGEGHSIEAAKEKIGQTIESITSAEAAYSLAKKHQVDAPITEQVAAILRGESTPAKALRDLLTREQKEE